MATNIEWTNPPGYKGDVWNPTTGCDKVSAGCTNCYAMKMANRLSNIASTKDAYIVTVKKLANGEVNWTGKINLLEDRLSIPLRRKKPTAWFVNSMSDLFHEDIPFEFIDKVFAVMSMSPQHIFQILTKRPERMRQYMQRLQDLLNPKLTTFDEFLSSDISSRIRQVSKALGHSHFANAPLQLVDNTKFWKEDPVNIARSIGCPPRNIWLGVSCEDQKTADFRIPILLDTPAAVRWISAEPLLGNIDLKHLHGEVVEIDCLNGTHGVFRPHSGKNNKLDQVIVGGESGSNARPSHPDWFRSLRDQCVSTGVPFFFKQHGNYLDVDTAIKEHRFNPYGQHKPYKYIEGTKLPFVNLGKNLAGRILDGRTWDEYPVIKQ